MPTNQGGTDCKKLIYNFEITLVDELNQAIDNVPYKVLVKKADVELELASGTTSAEGKITLKNMPPKLLRLVLATEPFLEVMQQEKRYLRLSRHEADSPIKADAKSKGHEYHYAKVGQLINGLPENFNWSVEMHKNANWQDDKGNPILAYPTPLPKYHFPLDRKNMEGWHIIPNPDNKSRNITIEVCPFRVWSLLLEHTEEYSLVNAYNLSLMSILAYSNFEKTDGGSDKGVTLGSIHQFFGEALYDLSQLPSQINDQSFIPIVKDVPFNQRYIQYEFIDTLSKNYSEDGIGNTQCFYIVNEKQAIIAWRGTAQLAQDIATDLTGLQVDTMEDIGTGHMHLGFKQAYEVKASLNKLGENAFERMDAYTEGKELFITGHSLGGALALIDSAIKVKQDRKPLLYTYGMPRVFDEKAVQRIQFTHYRHVNENDAVASVPKSNVRTQMMYGLSHDVFDLLTSRFSTQTLMKALDIRDRLFGDNFYRHHGHLVHFLRVQDNSEATSTLKLLISLDVIGMDCETSIDTLCRSFLMDGNLYKEKGFNAYDHSSAYYTSYLHLRLNNKIQNEFNIGSRFFSDKKAIFDDSVLTNSYINALPFIEADNTLIQQPFSVEIEQVNIKNSLLRFANKDQKYPINSNVF